MQEKVKQLFSENGLVGHRCLVGHSLYGDGHDLAVLGLENWFPGHLVYDTQEYCEYFFCQKLGLKNLASKCLNKSIQEGEHDSVQDAQVTMQLFKIFQRDWKAKNGCLPTNEEPILMFLELNS